MTLDSENGDGGHRALVAALLANLTIVIAKALAAMLTGSVVMLAETVHSLADTSKQGLLFLGRLRERRNADGQHPLGYGPERYFWAFLVAILLFPGGAIWAFIESLDQFLDPQPIEHLPWAVAVLCVSLIVEAASLRVALREARRVEPARSLIRFIRRTREPDLPSVLLEDLGAVIGAVVALISIGISVWTGDPRWDAIGGFAIAALLLGIGSILTIEFKSLLIGESALPEDLAAIANAIRRRPGVRSLENLRTVHLAPRKLLVLVRISLDSELELNEAIDVIESIRSEIQESIVPSAWVHVEPCRAHAEDWIPEETE